MLNSIKKIVFLILFSPIIALSQDKKETEEWILNKLNIYSNSGLTLSTPKFNKSIKFKIENGYLVSRQDFYPTTIARISEFSDFTYSIFDGFYDEQLNITIPTIVIAYLHCKNGEKCVRSYEQENNSLFYSDNKFRIDLDEDFKRDNLPERMKKAFSNLIKYNGGEVIVEKY
jgi:hypothetical protein